MRRTAVLLFTAFGSVVRTQESNVTNPRVHSHITAVARCTPQERVLSGGFLLRTQRPFDLQQLVLARNTPVDGGWLVDAVVQQIIQGVASVKAFVLCHRSEQ